MQKNSSSRQGQALPEYLPLVAMIAIASLVILGLFGDTLQQKFSHIATELAGKQATSQPSQTPPTTTPTTTPTNNPTTEPTTSPTDPVKCESHWTDDKYQSRECNGRWYCGFQKFTDEIKAAANVIYDFFEGVASGIGDQLKGLWDLLKDPSVLYDVAKAFIDDPKGTIEAIVKGLGDDVERVLECGPKDVGKVIGQYASPAMALKVLTKVAKITKSKKLTKYVDEIECGFASFAAGTTIWTNKGQVVIDDIQVGQAVYSRNKNNHKDRYQKVTKTFGRTAPSYYLLTTEFETLKVTEEHPLWLQGKGWTKVSEITVNDVIASLDGDVLILDNKKVETPLQVYNFSVVNTPNYFVGESKIWAHNAKLPCKRATKPTGIKDGKPSGDRAPETGPQKRTHTRENESADLLAKNGYKVKQNPDTLPNGKNPDFEIEGKIFDNLAPNSSNIDQVRKGISKKVNEGQTERIVLNLDDSPFSPNDIKDMLARKPKEGLLEVIGIKNGKITQIFP